MLPFDGTPPNLKQRAMARLNQMADTHAFDGHVENRASGSGG
jgi:hypothetical protein